MPLGYIRAALPEDPEDRTTRLQRVAARRNRVMIMTQRGSRNSATENTLEAYLAAMNEGADGCEIDIYMSRDGIPFCMHNEKHRMVNCTYAKDVGASRLIDSSNEDASSGFCLLSDRIP